MIWSLYTGRWWVGCHILYSDEGTGRGASPPRPLLAVPAVTAYPSTASVPITVFLYNGSLLCGFVKRCSKLSNFTQFIHSSCRLVPASTNFVTSVVEGLELGFEALAAQHRVESEINFQTQVRGEEQPPGCLWFIRFRSSRASNVLRPVYNDATQLNSTSSWVELSRYRHPHWVTTFRTDRWLQLFTLWTCRQIDIELSCVGVAIDTSPTQLNSTRRRVELSWVVSL